MPRVAKFGTGPGERLRRFACLFYEPGIGVNPVILADWRVFVHDIRRKWRSYLGYAVILYLAMPGLAAYVLARMNWLGQGYTVAPDNVSLMIVSRFFVLMLGAAILNYFAAVLLILINPLGNAEQNAIYRDPPLAEEIAAKVLAARLLPRLAIVPFVMFFTAFVVFFPESWSVDIGNTSLPFAVSLLVIGAVLASLELIWIAVLIHLFVPYIWFRALIVISVLFITLLSVSQASAWPDQYASTDVYRVFNPLSSVGTVDVCYFQSQAFIGKTSLSKIHPLARVGSIMGGQLMVIALFMWYAIRGFMTGFGRRLIS